jgi:hypothetical protein
MCIIIETCASLPPPITSVKGMFSTLNYMQIFNIVVAITHFIKNWFDKKYENPFIYLFFKERYRENMFRMNLLRKVKMERKYFPFTNQHINWF